MKRVLLFTFFALAISFFGCEETDPYNELGGGSSGSGGSGGSENNIKPDAAFDFETGYNLTVRFINQSQNATSYYWDFGDGTYSSETSPTHTYSTFGTKKVTLKAERGPLSETAEQYIYLHSSIKMVNISENPYQIYIDNSYKGIIQGGYNNTYEVSPGSHTVSVVQDDGYILFPTEEDYDVNIQAGYIRTIEFPESPLGK